MDTKHPIGNLRHTEIHDEARQGKCLRSWQLVVFSHQVKHRFQGYERRLVQIFMRVD